jgi:hypothetical protein
MTGKSQESQTKSISEQLSEVLRTLSPNQVRFVVARQDYLSDKEAAEAVGLKPDTVYRWNGNVKRAVQLFAEDIMSGAAAIRRKNLAKAMMVKAAGLDSNDESIRQKAATELIEWEMGKAQQRVQSEVSGVDGAPITHRLIIERVDERHE